MEDKLACLLEGLWSAWNKSVQICGICGRLIYLWEIIIRGSAFIRGEKEIIRGIDLVQWDTKYLEEFVVQIENTQ